MARAHWILTFLLLQCCPTGNSFATNWTPDQRDILEVVAAYTEASHQGDRESYFSFWHPDFLGWHNGDPTPTSKEQRQRGLEHYFNSTKSLRYELEPLAVMCIAKCEAAIVHYVLRNVLVNKTNGTEMEGISYWTDYLIKENGHWLLISDHGGEVQ
jgi:ketosteroid isomerase-like protein